MDAPAAEVAGWSTPALETVVADVKKLAAPLESFRVGKADLQSEIRLHGRLFTVRQIQELFNLTDDELKADAGNRILRRGALLHADVALLAAQDFSRSASQGSDAAFIVEDGRTQGTRHQTVHWALGRSLLSAITPDESRDPTALLWYRAASASLLSVGGFSEAYPHLASALTVFPDNAELLIDSACMHQRFSSPEIQAAVQSLSEQRGITTNVGSLKSELELAERFFRRALAVQPDRADARIRRGRILGLLGRHDEAASELRKAMAENPTREFLYYARLFLGREEEALGHFDAARASFDAAAELYPRAQSPRLALSWLARRAGDRSGALRSLQYLADAGSEESRRPDPWWGYYELHLDDAGELLQQLRDTFVADQP
jgi:tetratricopeptide (TPR) repeat protein